MDEKKIESTVANRLFKEMETRFLKQDLKLQEGINELLKQNERMLKQNQEWQNNLMRAMQAWVDQIDTKLDGMERRYQYLLGAAVAFMVSVMSIIKVFG